MTDLKPEDPFAKMAEIAEAYDDALGDNGHCGEGSFEFKQRKAHLTATERRYREAFPPHVVIDLLAKIERLQEVEADNERLRSDIVAIALQVDDPDASLLADRARMEKALRDLIESWIGYNPGIYASVHNRGKEEGYEAAANDLEALIIRQALGASQ